MKTLFTGFILGVAATVCLGAEPQTAGSALTELSLDELMNIRVTSVSRTSQTLFETPAAVFVITKEDIRRSGATTIPELFRMVPGMNVARLDGNKWVIGVRAFSDRFQRFLLAQIDGRTLYSATFAGVYWDAVDYPLEDIERIEVIRGSGASVWGANAVNGIINIITKAAHDTQGGQLTVGGGNEEQAGAAFRHGGKLGQNLSLRAYGKGFKRDEQFTASGDPNDGWWGASVGSRLDWQASHRDAVVFDAGYLRSEAGRRDSRPMIAAPFVFTNREDEISAAAHVLVRWSRTLEKGARWSLQAYWDGFARAFQNLDVNQRWDTYDVDFQHQFPLGDRKTIVWGLGGRVVDSHLGNSERDDGFILSYVPNDSRQQLFSTFLQGQISLVPDKVRLTLGSKVEHNDFTGFELEPTARLLWTPGKQQTVWAAVSRAVRTPSVADDELRSTLLQGTPGVGPFPQTTGNPGLESEVLQAFELGYRAQATPTFSVDAAVFYDAYDKLRVQVPGAVFITSLGAAIRPQVRDNGMQGETYGGELAATWQPSRSWRVYGVYTFLKMNLDADQSLPSATRTGSEAVARQSPRHQGLMQSSWNLPGHVEFDLIGRFVDRVAGFNPSGVAGVTDTIDGYGALNARLAWRPRKNLELAVVGQDLLDSHHPESGTSPAVRSPLIEVQRSVYGRVTRWF